MKRIGQVICCLALILCCGCSQKSALNPQSPVTIQLWNYYSGKQLDSFNRLVDTFNGSVGKDKGIIVESTSIGTVNELGQAVMDAANKKVGAEEVPNIFAAYADTVYKVDQLGIVQELNDYFSKDELSEYVDGYINEGYIDGNSLKIFPIAKSTEVMMINMTDFQKFAGATGTKIEELSTIEGVTQVAQRYYEYTNGKAFFGRDALANYLIIGLKQLGHNIISVQNGKTVIDFDKSSVRKIWDHYYVPYIKGYFLSEGRFRSDDVKMGSIISCVGSSSGATFFPNRVIVSDEESYDIEVEVLEAPIFKDGQEYAVQQGAGMVVTKSDDAHVEGSVEFLKWFTKHQQNISFSIESGYLPVTKAANHIDTIEQTTTIESAVIKKVIEASVKTVNKKHLYTTPATETGTELRNYLESCLKDKAVNDRQSIETLLQQGQDKQKVISSYDNDENFENWYQETYKQLRKVAKIS